MKRIKALIGMSGGVDSSVAAWLCQQEGMDCVGASMALYCPGEENPSAGDARAVAEGLKIPFQLLDFREAFAQKVMDAFVRSYEAGYTPNPCIVCNHALKFGAMLDAAIAMGCTHVVTGHYAAIRRDEESGRYLLCKAKDSAKDQTYFLACLTQYQLAHTLFPLGDLTKAQVRRIAQEHGFVTAGKRDSQDICFVPGGDYVAFLEAYTGKRYAPGAYLDRNGRVVGTHRGAVAYTLGQRKGLGVALGAPMYVCGKDMQANTVTLGRNEDLFSSALLGQDMNWFPFPTLEAPLSVTAKIRHSQYEQEAVVYPMEGGQVRVEFAVPQRAVTPGQAVVLYQGDTVVGGGTIARAIK